MSTLQPRLMMSSGAAAVMTPYTPNFLVLVLLIMLVMMTMMMMLVMLMIMMIMMLMKRWGMEEQSCLQRTTRFGNLGDVSFQAAYQTWV